jgi:hypothetical protein
MTIRKFGSKVSLKYAYLVLDIGVPIPSLKNELAS